MRILHLTHQGDIGGSTNSITWLCRGLAQRGHEVFLACRPESLIASRFPPDGPVRRVDLNLPRGFSLLREAGGWREWIRQNRIDVANAHASLDRHLLSYIALRGSEARIVHTRRNVALSTGGWLRAQFDTRTTSGIIAVSGNVAEDLVRRGIPPEHVHTVLNGLPLEEVRLPDPARAAALRGELGLREGVPVAGVFARRKSQEELLRAAALRAKPLEILFAGIEEDDPLREAARELPEEVTWRCLGFRDDVADLSGLADVFVLPSVIEGFSLALLEAMVRGLPCIASDAGGNAEALAEGAGQIYAPGDVPALAEALARVLDDPAAAADWGRRASARARTEFSVERTVERTEQAYAAMGAPA